MLPVTTVVVFIASARALQYWVSNMGKVELQRHERKVMPRQEDTRRKVVGSYPNAVKKIFS